MYLLRSEQLGWPTLYVEGSIMGPHWARFVRELRALAADGSNRIGLDLSRTFRMGVEEARFLLDFRNRLRRDGRELTIVALLPASIAALSEACLDEAH